MSGTDGTYDHPGHVMHGWPLMRRVTRLLEAVCSHGTGHPIPESVRWLDEHGPEGARGTWNVHGCDGCCTRVTSECECNVSTGIDERITAGTGRLDRLGFWEHPCTHGKAERLQREYDAVEPERP